MRVAKRLGDGISLGDVGVRVLPAGSGDVRGSLVSGTPFWANVDTDTDMLVKPLPNGAESFWQLRSQASPERLRLKLDLPAGAQLRLAGAPAGPEAVEVVKAGKVVAKIAAPGTRDADGQPVPTSMGIDGHDVVVTVSHHGRDVAYPLMVDPTMTVSEPDWYASNSSDFDGWQWVSGNTYAGARPVSSCYPVFACSYFFFGFPDFWDEPQRCVGVRACDGAWGRGLYTISNGGATPAGEWAQWAFVAGNAGPEINISRAELKDAWANNGCRPAGCGIAHIQGLWRQTNWVSMSLTTSGYSGQRTYCSPATCDVPTTGQNAVAVVQQIATWTGGTFPSNLDYLASASLVISDDTAPNSLTATHSNQPSGWVHDANETVTASAADGGVGVKDFDVVAHKPDGSTQTLAQAVNPCPGNRHGWCPPNWTANLPYNTQGLPEGDNTLTITAKDAWGNQTDSAPWHVNIDRTAPTFDLENDLRPDSQAYVGGTGQVGIFPDDERSGVNTMGLFIDNAPVDPSPSPCVGGICEFVPDTSGMTSGTHTLRAVVTDQAGNSSQKTSSFYVDHAGPSITLSGSLKDAEGQPLTNPTYSLNVATTDGSSSSPQAGVRSIEIAVNGQRADYVDQECDTNSCPLSRTWTYNDSAYGSGPQTIEVTATDAAGNETTQSFTVNDASHPHEPQACTQSVLASSGEAACSYDQPACGLTPNPRSGSSTNLLLTADQAYQDVLLHHPGAIGATQAATALVEGLSVAPTLNRARLYLEGTQSLTGTIISQDPAGGFRLGTGADAICLKPTAVENTATAAGGPGTDATIFANTQHAVDTITRPTAEGVESMQEIRDASAPESFSWKVDLQGGQTLQRLDNGSVAIVAPTFVDLPDEEASVDDETFPTEAPAPGGNPESSLSDAQAQMDESDRQLTAAQRQTAGATVGVIHAPWARDANGQSVPTSLSVSGDTVTMTVGHHAGSYAYPILADPQTSSTFSLRFVSYNIRGHDRKPDHKTTPDPIPPIDVNAITSALARTYGTSSHRRPPDVIGLQEVCAGEAKDIRDRLKSRYHTAMNYVFNRTRSFYGMHACHGGSRPYGNAIMVRTKYGLVKHGSSSCQIGQPPCAGLAEASRLQWVTVHTGYGTMRIYNTHMGRDDNFNPDPHGDIADVGARFNGDSLPRRMIMGDWNVSPSLNRTPGHRYLEPFDGPNATQIKDYESTCQFTDTNYSRHCNQNQGSWTHYAPIDKPPPPRNRTDGVKYDYSYFSFQPRAGSGAHIPIPVYANNHNEELSDHRPLVSDIVIPKGCPHLPC